MKSGWGYENWWPSKEEKSDLAKLLGFIMKKYRKNPEKWLPKFSAALKGRSQWLRQFDPEELNALYYVFFKEGDDVGHRYAELGMAEEAVLANTKLFVSDEMKIFTKFAELCRAELDKKNQANWRKMMKQMNRKLVFKLEDQNGKETAFKDLANYKDKYIAMKLDGENCEEQNWLIWQPGTKVSGQTVSTTSQIAECTYYGFACMGGAIRTITDAGKNKLEVYDSYEDYIKGRSSEKITFIGPDETYSGSGEETITIQVTEKEDDFTGTYVYEGEYGKWEVIISRSAKGSYTYIFANGSLPDIGIEGKANVTGGVLVGEEKNLLAGGGYHVISLTVSGGTCKVVRGFSNGETQTMVMKKIKS